MGVGETFDPSKAVAAKTGSYVKHPAGAVHWDGAMDEEVVLQIVDFGPSETTPVSKEGGIFTSAK